MSDRERDGVRGSVKICVYESTMPDGKKLFTEIEYSLDGKLLTTRSTQSGASEWVTSQTYDAEGRLGKIVSEKPGGPRTESVYTVTGNTAFPVGVAYSAGENGTLAPQTVSDTPSVPIAPKLATIEYRYEYDEHGNWTEQTAVRRSESNESSNVRRRTLTYC